MQDLNSDTSSVTLPPDDKEGPSSAFDSNGIENMSGDEDALGSPAPSSPNADDTSLSTIQQQDMEFAHSLAAVVSISGMDMDLDVCYHFFCLELTLLIVISPGNNLCSLLHRAPLMGRGRSKTSVVIGHL